MSEKTTWRALDEADEAKTAANWQAFSPQTLAFTAPTFFRPLQPVSGAIQFLVVSVQKGDSGFETLNEPWLSPTRVLPHFRLQVLSGKI